MISSDKLFETYGGKVRVRVAGILANSEGIILANHSGLNDEHIWWSPPGGGVSLGETMEDALIREFEEETGVRVMPQELLCVSEYINLPLHAVEVFFLVRAVSGELLTGIDPELDTHEQQINEVRNVTFQELQLIKNEHKHQLFRDVSDFDQLLEKRGFFPHA